MSKCDIKDSAKAWNDGLDAFKKAFKQTGGKTTESIKYAVDEINSKNPDFEFDVKSFSDPLVNSLKEKGVIPKDYKFKGSSQQKNVEKIAEKLKGLSPDQKKSFARKAFSKIQEDGMLNEEAVKNIYSEAIGVPAMDEKMQAQIKKTSRALQEYAEVEKQVKEEIKAMQADKDANSGKLSAEKDKEYQKKFEALGEARMKAQDKMMKEKTNFSDMLIEKRFWLHQLGDYMPLNLMNPKSLVKNVSGAIIDAMHRAVSNAISVPVSAGINLVTGVNSNPAGARAKGVARGKYKHKASLAWKYGQTDFTSELPQANHLNANKRFQKAMDASGMEKFKGMLSAALKIHPSIISKSLTAPDAVAFEAVMSSELNRIAESKGLKGAEKEAFLLEPDEKSTDIATKLAKKATFKQDVPKWLTKLASYDPHEASKKLIEEGSNLSPLAIKLITGVRALAQKSAFPFVKTPINIVRTASRIVLPEYELAKNLIEAKNETDPVERQRLVIDGTTKAAVGFYVRYIAFQMVAQGLISGGYNDEDKKTKDIVEQEFGGPNKMNWSAFVRGLTGRDMKKKAGDNIVDMSSLGALGMAMNVYSHAFGKYGKNEFKERAFYNKSLLNALGVPKDLAFAELTASLDQTFLTGANQILGALENEYGFEANKLGVQYVSNLFTGIVPSTAQQLLTQVSPNVKKQFDTKADFLPNLAAKLGYNFAGQSDKLKDKYFSLAEEGKEAKKKKSYMFLDNYLGRVLEAETDFLKLNKSNGDTPVSRLFKASREVGVDERDKLFPAAISDEISIKTKKKGDNKVKLTEEQHNYLQEQASMYRMMLATPFIMSEDFDKVDFETKTKVLQAAYTEGLKNAKEDLRKMYPNIRNQKLDNGSTDQKEAKKLIKKYKTKK